MPLPSSLQNPVQSEAVEMPTASFTASTVCWLHRVLTEDLRLPEAIRGRFRAVALTTGMRPSEYLALRWRDIDWDRGTLSVVRSLHKNEGQWTFADTKRVRSRRVVKLQTRVLDLLRKLKGGADEDGAACDSVMADLIFTTARGDPINEEYLVKKHFKPLLREAGLPDIRLYDLRHTAATLALTVGIPPKVVSEQLGHASAAFTLDTYSHVLPHMQEEAAVKMEAALLGERKPAA
jgi:integrase